MPTTTVVLMRTVIGRESSIKINLAKVGCAKDAKAIVAELCHFVLKY